MRVVLQCLALLLFLSAAFAGETPLTLASLFSDNMVLQQQQEVPLWGTGPADAQLSVNASWGEHATTVVSHDGTWMLHLTTPAAGGPYTITVTCGADVQTLKNVLTGEVWICSGQSNMEMPMRGWPPRDTIAQSARDIQAAALPQIRLFNVARATAPAPEHDVHRFLDGVLACNGRGLQRNGLPLREASARGTGRSHRSDPDLVGRHARAGVDRTRNISRVSAGTIPPSI